MVQPKRSNNRRKNNVDEDDQQSGGQEPDEDDEDTEGKQTSRKHLSKQQSNDEEKDADDEDEDGNPSAKRSLNVNFNLNLSDLGNDDQHQGGIIFSKKLLASLFTGYAPDKPEKGVHEADHEHVESHVCTPILDADLYFR